MITLNEEIEINVPYERMEAWANNFEEEFVKWRPYHIECEQDSNHFRIVFQSTKKTVLITFEGKRTESGCHFSHTEAFGLTTSVIGSILEFLTFKVFYRKWCNWALIREDMILDNKYLNDILTKGKYPKRIPMDELMKTVK